MKMLLIILVSISVYAENCKTLMNKADNFYVAGQQRVKYVNQKWEEEKLFRQADYWRGRAIYCQNEKIQIQLKRIKKESK